MTSERDKCGLTSLLPISCRDRAEAFARSLQSRLSTLGSQEGSSEERSWLGSPHDSTVALSQPHHNPDPERYLALEVLESPCSPQEEIDESELHKLWENRDLLVGRTNGDCHANVEVVSEVKCNGLVRHYSGDSDSEVFYDLDDEESPEVQPYENGLAPHSESSKSIDSETGIDVNSLETSSGNLNETFATSLDCTPQPSVSEDITTLSIKDDEEVSTSSEAISNKDDEALTVNVECSVSKPAAEDEDSDTNSANKTEEDDCDDTIPRVRRCSSLKTGKTPPGTPSRKKIVRFADVLGLDLADVRTFLDEIPKVPKSAYNDLSDVDLSDSSDLSLSTITNKFHGIRADRILMPLFEQPSGTPNFLDQVRDQQVCLENALVDDPILFSIKGTVRVRNLDFNKSVHIRYSLDSWKTYADVQATYLTNSCDGFSDRFAFTLYAHTLTIGQKLEFACRFQCKGCQYWDNNKGRNYCFQCLPTSSGGTSAPVLITHGHSDWGASFY
ncbi:glycogen-binding subunit 76A isoform X2 [Euwallacea similis]|uniref:glycogen-binding subunit 76A isoform X2 n=1 Tax=Euwallacea similis TaxID=1736056 RepID=UPI00344B618D